jgi:CRP/FNR family transcriptional regulator, cyclic AMP receptor protein
MAQPAVAQRDHSLRGIGVFSEVSSAALGRIQRRCSWRCYEPGESIVNYLDPSDEVFFLAAGEARVTIYSVTGKAVSFSELGPGDTFGEYPAIVGGPRSASVEARTRCLVASMSSDAFRKLLHDEPTVAQALLVKFVKKIRSLTARIYEFSTLAVNNRIQAEILRLANLVPRSDKSATIVPSPTHADIASRVSTHREAVTRELNRLAKMGVIERRGSALLVKDVGRLAQLVHDATGEEYEW